MKIFTVMIVTMMMFAIMIIFILYSANVLAVSTEYCVTDCSTNESLYYVQSIYGGATSIGQNGINIVSNNFDWQSNTEADFSLKYDSINNKLIIQLDNKIFQLDNLDANAGRLLITGKTSIYGGNSVLFKDLYLDDNRLDDFRIWSGNDGLIINLDNNDFDMHGKILMDATDNTNNNVPAFMIYALNSVDGSHHHRAVLTLSNNELNNNISDNISDVDLGQKINDDVEVPEFGVIATLLAIVAGIGIILYRKK